LFGAAVNNCPAAVDCSCPVPIASACFPSSPLPSPPHTLPRTHLSSRTTNRSLPTSPAHDYTVSFLSRLIACSKVGSAGAPAEQFNAVTSRLRTVIRFIYIFPVGFRFICIQVGIGLDLGSVMALPSTSAPATSCCRLEFSRRAGGVVVRSAAPTYTRENGRSFEPLSLLRICVGPILRARE
jgi:hypothetical protein